MNKFELKVKNYISDNNLIEKNKKIILAFSYGIDSRSLLNVLFNLNYEIIVAHVNHKVRKESDIEEDETIKLCKELNIKYYIKHLIPQEENFEDYARRERYKFFEEVARIENTNILATAHHKDDNLETILLKLMTGSNLYGYAGIHNSVKRGNLTIIRPFLSVSKDEIKEYQKELGFKYFEDYTNSLNIHKRNYIRNNIIPLLKCDNLDILKKAIDYSNILNDSFNYIRNNSISYLNKWNNQILVSEYISLENALRHDIICLLLEENKINRSYKLILSIDKALLKNKAQFEIKLEGDFYLFKRYNKAYISKKIDIEYNSIFLMPNEKKSFGKYNFYFSTKAPSSNENYIKLCYNSIEFPVEIRNRKDGDKITLSYGTKKVKDLMIDKKIDKEIRKNIPIVLIGGKIIWICGIAKSSLIKDGLDNGDIYLIQEVNYG